MVKVQPKPKKVVKSTVTLPSVTISKLTQNQIKSTFWNETDDEKLMKEIDWTGLDEDFKIQKNIKLTNSSLSDIPENSPTSPKLESLLEPKRLTKDLSHPTWIQLTHTVFLFRVFNIGIQLRGIKLKVDEIVIAIENLDLKTLPLDQLDALIRLELNDEEIKAFKGYSDDPMKLMEADR